MSFLPTATTARIVTAATNARAGTARSTAAATPTFPTPASARVPSQRAATPARTATATVTPAKPLTTAIPGVRTVRPAHSKQGSTHLSSGAIALAALGAVLLLACAAWALARWRAYEPHWLVSLRHALAEAGFRMSATWAEFADWLRLGH